MLYLSFLYNCMSSPDYGAVMKHNWCLTILVNSKVHASSDNYSVKSITSHLLLFFCLCNVSCGLLVWIFF